MITLIIIRQYVITAISQEYCAAITEKESKTGAKIFMTKPATLLVFTAKARKNKNKEDLRKFTKNQQLNFTIG